MNIESFENLRAWIDSHRNLVQVGNPAVKQLITAAEEFLRVKFPDAYVLFLKTWGTLALGPLEFYGITGPNFDRGTVPNGIWYTNIKRSDVGLPQHLVILYDDNGDEYYCLDTSSGNVVIWDVIARNLTAVKSEDLFKVILNEFQDFVQ